MSKTVQFQTIQFSISTQFKCKYGLIVNNICISSYFSQIIQFRISMPLVLFNPSIGPYQVLPHRDQSVPGSDVNEGVLRIPQSSSIAEPHYQIV